MVEACEELVQSSSKRTVRPRAFYIRSMLDHEGFSFCFIGFAACLEQMVDFDHGTLLSRK